MGDQIEKTLVKNNEGETLYFVIKLPDTTSWTRWGDQAKPFINHLIPLVEESNAQAGSLYKSVEELEQTKTVLTDKNVEAEDELERMANHIKQIENVNTLLKDQIDKDTDAHNKAEQNSIDNLTGLDNTIKDQQQAIDREIATNTNLQNAYDIATAGLAAAVAINKELEKTVKLLKGAKPDDKHKNDIEKLKKLLESLKKKGSTEHNNDKDDKSTKDDEFNSSIDGSEDESTGQKASFRIKMNTTLPTFHGRPHENIGEWLYQANRTLDFAKYKPVEKVAVASNYLRDVAAQDYMLHERAHGKQTWKQFEGYMSKKYTPVNHNDKIRKQVMNLKQLTNVADYFNEFRKLTIQSTLMTDDEKLAWFKTGLKPKIAQFVQLAQCSTLDTAYEQAELFETYSSDKESHPVYFVQQATAAQSDKFGQENEGNMCSDSYSDSDESQSNLQDENNQKNSQNKIFNRRDRNGNNNVNYNNVNQAAHIASSTGNTDSNQQQTQQYQQQNYRQHGQQQNRPQYQQQYQYQPQNQQQNNRALNTDNDNNSKNETNPYRDEVCWKCYMQGHDDDDE